MRKAMLVQVPQELFPKRSLTWACHTHGVGCGRSSVSDSETQNCGGHCSSSDPTVHWHGSQPQPTGCAGTLECTRHGIMMAPAHVQVHSLMLRRVWPTGRWQRPVASGSDNECGSHNQIHNQMQISPVCSALGLKLERFRVCGGHSKAPPAGHS